MTAFRALTETFSVAPQIAPEDFAAAAAAGFRLVINNRPDGEAPGQMTSAEAEAAARAAGLAYRHIPVVGSPTPAQAQAVGEAAAAADGPTLAYCRSGTRSTFAWAMAALAEGRLSPDEVVARAAAAGYDVAALARR